jgi:hypothetical protein
MKKRGNEEVDMDVRIILKRIFRECGHMEQTHIFIVALLRVVRNEDTGALKKGCLDLHTVKVGCGLPVWVLVD